MFTTRNSFERFTGSDLVEISLGKFDDTLPDLYGEDPEELARRLTKWGEQFMVA